MSSLGTHTKYYRIVEPTFSTDAQELITCKRTYTEKEINEGFCINHEDGCTGEGCIECMSKRGHIEESPVELDSQGERIVKYRILKSCETMNSRSREVGTILTIDQVWDIHCPFLGNRAVTCNGRECPECLEHQEYIEEVE